MARYWYITDLCRRKQEGRGKIRIRQFYGASKGQRNANLEKVLEDGGICLTTYGMLLSNIDDIIAEQENDDPKQEAVWNYVVLDEGHKIKNPSTKISKAVRRIPSDHRIILTGTPVMNNLQDMWALFDFTAQGKLLGDSKTFKAEYETPILKVWFAFVDHSFDFVETKQCFVSTKSKEWSTKAYI